MYWKRTELDGDLKIIYFFRFKDELFGFKVEICFNYTSTFAVNATPLRFHCENWISVSRFDPDFPVEDRFIFVSSDDFSE